MEKKSFITSGAVLGSCFTFHCCVICILSLPFLLMSLVDLGLWLCLFLEIVCTILLLKSFYTSLQSLNCIWGTTFNAETVSVHFDLSLTTFCELTKARSVQTFLLSVSFSVSVYCTLQNYLFHAKGAWDALSEIPFLAIEIKSSQKLGWELGLTCILPNSWCVLYSVICSFHVLHAFLEFWMVDRTREHISFIFEVSLIVLSFGLKN